MEPDPREQRLRRNFGWTMAWTALALVVFGALLGSVFETALGAAGQAFGFTPTAADGVAVKIVGDVVVGLIVLFGILRRYLAPVPIEH